ncbi:hypothetical protein BSF38_05649 [Paludisphaera borealis]|uniref:Uncharacterized protein n=1 Tax=Paludisphaera borealis TaxID=1387353 RepID=A0A1U7CYW1_9BACT|nr:hypothetical protein BSF38_05649 [Paludisphaera borealis]
MRSPARSEFITKSERTNPIRRPARSRRGGRIRTSDDPKTRWFPRERTQFRHRDESQCTQRVAVDSRPPATRRTNPIAGAAGTIRRADRRPRSRRVSARANPISSQRIEFDPIRCQDDPSADGDAPNKPNHESDAATGEAARRPPNAAGFRAIEPNFQSAHNVFEIQDLLRFFGRPRRAEQTQSRYRPARRRDAGGDGPGAAVRAAGGVFCRRTKPIAGDRRHGPHDAMRSTTNSTGLTA